MKIIEYRKAMNNLGHLATDDAVDQWIYDAIGEYVDELEEQVKGLLHTLKQKNIQIEDLIATNHAMATSIGKDLE